MKLGGFFGAKNDVLIDGSDIKSISDAVNMFANISSGDFQFFPEAISFLDEKFGLEKIYYELIRVYPQFPFDYDEPNKIKAFDDLVQEIKDGIYDNRQ